MGLVQLPNHTCLERIICSIDYHYPHLLKQIRPAGLHAALVILSYLSRIINFAMSVFDRLSSNWEVGGGGGSGVFSFSFSDCSKDVNVASGEADRFTGFIKVFPFQSACILCFRFSMENGQPSIKQL